MRIHALCTIDAGLDILRLLCSKIRLSSIIGLTDRPPSEAVSGYRYMEPFAREIGVPFVGVDSYSLSRPEDRQKLEAEDMDVLLVCGWQRLIPDWLITHARVGAIGAHGSPEGISAGRGRSPQNWAIILGAKEFNISIFFIDEGIDSGKVIASRTFPLTDHDDIASSYAKTVILTAEMIVESLTDGSIEARRGEDQPAEAFYLPQRLPEDGAIDWARPTRAIAAYIRGLTRPYPGAYTWAGPARMVIWRARPFEITETSERPPAGTVRLVLASGAFIVATTDGYLLVDEFESQEPPQHGIQLRSVPFPAVMETIVQRHRNKHPDLPISPRILEAMKDGRGTAG